MAVNGRRRSDDADMVAFRDFCGRIAGGLDHAEDRDRKLLSKIGERDRADRSACNDDRFNAFGKQKPDVLFCIMQDRFGRTRSVGYAGGIAEIYDG